MGFINPTMEVVTVLGDSEVLDFENLEFPVFLDESDDGEGLEVVRGAVCGSGLPCGLHRDQVLWSQVLRFCRGTNMYDNFPRRFDYFVNGGLSVENEHQLSGPNTVYRCWTRTSALVVAAAIFLCFLK